MSENPRKKLPGKVAVITGGASGIGQATARLFAEEGARVVIIADIQESLGQEVVRSIGPDRCRFVYVDVTDEEQVRSMVELAVRDYGRIDIMFSNAGILSRSEQKVIDLDLGEFDRLIAVNVRGMAACVKHSARAMVEGSVRGSIVCTGSVSGSSAGSRRTDYHMAKHAVVGLVKSASVQLGGHGIRVNCVSPYAIATPLLCDAWGADPEEVEKMYEPHTALKGRVLRVEDVADAVLFLASDDSQFITGHNLVVDGGYLHYKGGIKTSRVETSQNSTKLEILRT